MLRRSIYILALLTLVLFAACNSKIVTKSTKIEKKAGYDTADFGIIFNDALRQKMLGNQANALRLFERAITINANSDASYYQISQIYQSGGDIRNALKYAVKAESLDNKNSWYIHNAGIQYYMAGVLDSAIFYFEKLILLEPDREDYKLTLAGFYESNHNYVKAEAIVNEFISVYGNESELLKSLVRIYRLQGRKDDAEATLMRLIASDSDTLSNLGLLAEYYKSESRNDDAIRVYNRLYELDPESVDLHLSFLDFLRTSKAYDDFISGVNNLILNDSIPLEGKGNIFAGILNDKDFLAEKGVDIEFPAMLFASNYRNNAEVALLISQIFDATGNEERSISTLRNYCEKNPENYMMWERLMFAYSSSGLMDDLYSTAKYVSTKFNLYPVPKLLLAFAANDRKEYNLALSELDKVITLAGNQEELLIEAASLMANIYYEKGDFEIAFTTYEKGLEMSPNNALLLNNYAYFLSEQGLRLKEARAMIERCLTIESNSTYLDTYAWVLYKLEKFKKANDIMEALHASKQLESADHYEHLGYIKKALKDCDNAIVYWLKAIETDSEKEELQNEIDKCRTLR